MRDSSLTEHLQHLCTRGAVVIADAATEDDMARLRRAALNLPHVALIGSSGILTDIPVTPQPTSHPMHSNLLIITASRRNEVKGQIAHFAAHVHNSRSICLDPDDLPEAETIGESIRTAFAEGNSCVVAIDSTAILHPDIQQRFRHASEIVDRLALADSLADQIAADKHLQSKEAMKTKGLGIKLLKISPGGTV